MIEINLLPEENRKKKHSAAKADMLKTDFKFLPVINIALIVVGGIVAVQIFLFVMAAAAGLGSNIMENKYKEILPRKEKAELLKNQMKNMSNKVVAIDELMVKRFSWAKKLSDLNDSMTPGVWLTALEYDERLSERPRSADAYLAKKASAQEEAPPAVEKVLSRYLIISGAASSMGEEGTALIGRFIKNLKSNSDFYSDFSDIELGKIMREKIEDQEVMTFQITCLFKTR